MTYQGGVKTQNPTLCPRNVPTKVKEGVHTGGGETDLQTLEQARAEAIVKDVPVFLFDSVCYEFKQGFEVCHQRGARNPLSGLCCLMPTLQFPL